MLAVSKDRNEEAARQREIVKAGLSNLDQSWFRAVALLLLEWLMQNKHGYTRIMPDCTKLNRCHEAPDQHDQKGRRGIKMALFSLPRTAGYVQHSLAHFVAA